MTATPPGPLSPSRALVFCSYAREDEAHRAELQKWLEVAKRRLPTLDVWDDTAIRAGDDWSDAIRGPLDAAALIVLLLSPDFLASEYCLDVETGRALERRKEEGTTVVPIIVRPCAWRFAPLFSLQALPRGGTPVTASANQDSAWLEVFEGLWPLLEELAGRAGESTTPSGLAVAPMASVGPAVDGSRDVAMPIEQAPTLPSGEVAVDEDAGREDEVALGPGAFWMGDDGPDPPRRHIVRLTIPFVLARAPVTLGQWRALMHTDPAPGRADVVPVHAVSWYDAVAYCHRLSRDRGLRPAYELVDEVGHPGEPGYRATVRMLGRDRAGFRLPTESEWEYACRAGDESPRYGALDDAAWWEGNSDGEARPIRTRQPNAWGLFDMLGNVYEWCWDSYANYPNAVLTDPAPARDPIRRVIRGGCWASPEEDVSAHRRLYGDPVERRIYVGFRVARTDVVRLARPEVERITGPF